MKYLGSKRKIMPFLKPVIDRYFFKGRQDRLFIDLFTGGANVLSFLQYQNSIGIDNNPYIIALFQALQRGYIPPDIISKEEWYLIKNNKEKYPPELVGFVGSICSFNGVWFSSPALFYIDKRKSEGKQVCSYIIEGKNSLLKQFKFLNNTSFICCDYKDYKILTPPEKCLIYCDPPYSKGSDSYNKNFNKNEFISWCKNINKLGYTVLISEYEMPLYFKELLVIPIKSSLRRNINKEPVRYEKLFVLEGVNDF